MQLERRRQKPNDVPCFSAESEKWLQAENIVCRYRFAKSILVRLSYDKEIEHCETRSLENASERQILEEAAWVILNAGFLKSY